MKIRDIEGSLHILVRALSENEKAKVVLGGRSTCTDGHTVWIGALPPDNELAADLAFGKLFHECEHVDSTDFAVPNEDPVLWRKLGNILEDIRIERKRMSKYPGAKLALSRTVSAMVKQGGFSPVSASEDPLPVLQGYVLYRLRTDCLGQDALSSLADGAGAAFDATFSPQLRNRVDALMYDAEKAFDTRQVMKIAGAIMKAFEDAAKDDPPPPDDQNNDQGGDDSDTTQPGSGQAGDQGDDAESDSDDAASSSAQAGDDDSNMGAGDDNAAGNKQQTAGDGDAAKGNIQKLLASSGDGGLEQFDETLNRMLNVITDANPTGTLGEPCGEALPVGNVDGSMLIAKVRRATTALRARMAGYLQAMTLSSVSTARSGRRLDRNRVYRVEAGNPAIFRRTSEGRALDTAVYFLTDRSISMRDDNRLRLALDSVAAVSLSLENVTGVDTAIGVFPHAIGYQSGVGELKHFGLPMRKAIAGLNVVQPAGSTPMAEATLWAGLSLFRTNRPRKVLVVVTDGEPNSRPLMESVMADLKRMGIETAGIGIKTDAVKGLFDRYCVVNDLDELPKAVFGMMQETVLLEAA